MDGHAIRDSWISYLLLALIFNNVSWFRLQDDINIICRSTPGVNTQAVTQNSFLSSSVCATMTSCRRHLGFNLPKSKGYFSTRLSRYPNAMSTFQLSNLISSGDVSLNPGPTVLKRSCQICSRIIARNHRALHCNLCSSNYHMKCGQVTPKQYKLIQSRDPKMWTCISCLSQQPLPTCNFHDTDLLSALPFSSLSDESFSSVVGTQRPLFANLSPNDEECECHFKDLIQQLEKALLKI